jgi:hypothetical protein
MSLWMVMTIWGLVAISDGPLEMDFDECERVAAARRTETSVLFRDGEPMQLDGKIYYREDLNIFCMFQQRRPRRSNTFHINPFVKEQNNHPSAFARAVND